MRGAVGRITARLGAIGQRPGDPAELRTYKRLVATTVSFVIPPGLIWAMLYAAYGEMLAAAIPFAFSMLSLVGLIVFDRTGNYRLLRDGQLALMLALPALLQLALGGFFESSAVVVWGVVAPFGALALRGVRAASGWLVAYLVVVAAVGLLDPVVRRDNLLPEPLILGLFVANISALAGVTFALLANFISQREAALRLLADEQSRSEALLLNILPREIAPRLLEGEQNIADAYPQATVLFADIVGFTRLSERLEPREMVSVLNEVFTHFDDLTEKHGVEKIRTIGDNYMAVSGVPTPRADHAQALARLALDMRDHIRTSATARSRGMDFRIGLDSGPLVAGVIGRRKFVYDLWGDHVNTASRMESHGIPGAIQLTQATYELLRDEFECEARGAIEVKGKGVMPTWLLLGERDR